MRKPRLFPSQSHVRPLLSLLFLGLLLANSLAAQPAGEAEPPKAGPVEILKLDDVKPGMKATAWTVFKGNTAEPVPVEVLGVMKNSFGPGQDVIIAKLGGKATRTNVAAGMSGSPVYYEGKLIGAISLRYSVFSPDAIAGITPIELMLEIDQLDQSRPLEVKLSRPADSPGVESAQGIVPSAVSGEELALEIWNSAGLIPPPSHVTAIETPLTFSGVHDDVLKLFGGYFRKAGVLAMQGGAGGGSSTARGKASGSLNPGEAVAAVLVSGDLSISGIGTVTYNDGERVLAFGHALFNVGPIEMPMAEADVLTVLASKFSPAKLANSAAIVGALHQDRHSGIMGVLGETAAMIPVSVGVRRFGDEDNLLSEKNIRFEVFQNRKWTPPLLTLAIYNSIFRLNEFAAESTFRLRGRIEIDGEHTIPLQAMRTTTDMPVPAPLALASWVGMKAHRLLRSSGETPTLKQIDVTIDLIPGRRFAAVDHAWLEKTTVRPGDEVRGKVFLRPYRGERIETPFKIRIPSNAPKGRLRLLVSDAQTLNRATRIAAARTRLPNLSETVSLMNKEHGNHQLFISLLQSNVTARLEARTLPNLPLSVLNVMRQSSKQRLWLEYESPLERFPIAFDSIVSGSYSIDLRVE